MPVNGSFPASLLCLIQIRKGVWAYGKSNMSKRNFSNYGEQRTPFMAEIHLDSGGSLPLLSYRAGKAAQAYQRK